MADALPDKISPSPEPLTEAPTAVPAATGGESQDAQGTPWVKLLTAGGLAAGYLIYRNMGRPEEAPEAATDISVRRTVTINRPVDEVYDFWHNFENFPKFMEHLESVKQQRNGRSHWVARGPAGMKAEWDADIVEDREDELIRWQSLPGSSIENRGQVEFRPAPGDRGTEVSVKLSYAAPAGQVGRAIATLLGKEPEQQIREALRHVKQLLEAGELPTTHGQPAGRRGLRGKARQYALGETTRSA